MVVCTGNICRSPIGEVLLAKGLADLGHVARVHSAGTRATLGAADPPVVELMAEAGHDLAAHRSRQLDRELLAGADLVIGMAREHVREAVMLEPSILDRTFTLKELVRRGEAHGGRRRDESLPDWLARLVDGRQVSDLMGDDPNDDVEDPYRRRGTVYRKAVEEIAALTAELVRLVGRAPDGAP